MQEYEDALKYTKAILRIEPTNHQALDLEQYIKKKMKNGMFDCLKVFNRGKCTKYETCALCGSRGGTGGLDPPEKSQKYTVLSNTGPKNHKATKLALNVGPSLPRQGNTI